MAGHQDSKKPKRLLTRTERLNCYADEQSKLFRQWFETTEDYYPSSEFGDKNWSVWLDEQKIFKDLRWRIIDHM